MDSHTIVNKVGCGTGHSAKWKPSPKKSRPSTISVLPEGFSSIDRFRNKQTGTIDVWWLFDDGGDDTPSLTSYFRSVIETC